MSSVDPIYQEIFEVDIQEGNGVPAFVEGQEELSETSDSMGYVVVREASEQSETGTTGRDVWSRIHIPENKIETYNLANALFDNYNIKSSVPEYTSAKELEEIGKLLDAIVDSPPMVVARRYIERFSWVMTDDEWRNHIEKLWFEPFTVGNSSRSGFEHVFLETSSADTIGGLHWWWFYATKMDEMTYGGVDYGPASNAKAKLIPEVVTMDFKWTLSNGVTITKEPKGGFLVGLSVEGLMAMGTVRAMGPSGSFRTEFVGAAFDLVMYKDSKGGITKFYPVFHDIYLDPPDPPDNVASPFRLISVVVNPKGHDVGHEKFTLMNLYGEGSESLLGWKIIGPNGTHMSLNDVTLDVGEAKTFTIDLAAASLQLRNKAGSIKVMDPNGDVVQTVQYDRVTATADGAVLMWDGKNSLRIIAP